MLGHSIWSSGNRVQDADEQVERQSGALAGNKIGAACVHLDQRA
jgi:hypothetical protein